MGDEKQQFTIQIKGKAYRFEPIPPEDFERVVVVLNMGASQTKTIKVIMHVLGRSAGERQWDEITDLLIDGKVTTAQVSVDLFKTITDRMAKAEKSAKAKADAQ